MLEIDGGGGGGQLLRSTLALAAITGQDVRISDIRGNRPEPGLKPQHLTAVEMVGAVCDADLAGASPGRTELTFQPGDPRGGERQADIGTAGSIVLLFDSLLPLAVALDQPLSVTVTGGTEVKWSPPLATYRRIKLPLCRQFGLQAAVERDRTGFYPAGGGRATLHLAPSGLRPRKMTDRGKLQGAKIVSRESRELASADVANRQAKTARNRLTEDGIEVLEEITSTSETASAGSALSIVLCFEHTRAGFDALGERGKPAEQVAHEAVTPALEFQATRAAVDRYTGDQLLVTLALAGGELRIPEVTPHVESSIVLLQQFGFDIELSGDGPATISSVGWDSADSV